MTIDIHRKDIRFKVHIRRMVHKLTIRISVVCPTHMYDVPGDVR